MLRAPLRAVTRPTVTWPAVTWPAVTWPAVTWPALLALTASLMATDVFPRSPPALPEGTEAERVDLASLPGWREDDTFASWSTWLSSCRAQGGGAKALRPATRSTRLAQVCAEALASGISTSSRARHFFETRFFAFRVRPRSGEGFFTGYYEPEVRGSLVATSRFKVPIYDRPAELVTLEPGAVPPGLEGLVAARRRSDGTLEAFPDRAAIETGALEGLGLERLYVEDPVDRFFLQVQGSGRVRLTDGRIVRLAYSGRNGHPYTPIGRVVADLIGMPRPAMTMQVLRAWLAEDAAAARRVMRENRSFVFFRIAAELDADAGPIGGEGIPLTPLRSLAVDRSLWPYGVPVFVSTEVPSPGGGTVPLRRLMIAQDTGSAIVGPARGDVFFGSGDAAGERAGAMRATGDFIVLWPGSGP
jgi:membrane-bound lytic murein transglycosylase A